ncbi:MAG TPA: SpoIIE family protein phosphatase [Terriglobia bacterium]
MILYSALWMFSVREMVPVELGFSNLYLASEHSELVQSIVPGSPAEKAGLRPGDQILAINGRPIKDSDSIGHAWAQHRPGDGVELTVERPRVAAPFVVNAVFRLRRSLSPEGGIAGQVSAAIANAYPLPFLVVGVAILFLRPEDRNVWLLTLMFAGFIAIPGAGNSFANLGPALRTFLLAFRAIFDSLGGALFYYFFSVFPERSPLDRRAPWLKWLGFALGVSWALPGLAAGGPRAPAALVRLAGENTAELIRLSYGYGFIILGLVSLASNAFTTRTPEARRKIRVILWGTLGGVIPGTLLLAANDFLKFHVPLFLLAVVVILLGLFPVSFAYAVVKHRVLEIPVLLKRSARYLLVQRGFLVLTALVTSLAIWLFITVLAGFARLSSPITLPISLGFGIAFGALSTLVNLQIRSRVSKRIDRAFFRSAYDARQILENLALNIRKAMRREQLAALLEEEIKQALHPTTIAVYLEAGDGQLRLQRTAAQAALEPAAVSPDTPLLQQLRRRGEPIEIQPAGDGSKPLEFGSTEPECLVPLLGGDGRLTGVIALGSRLSEEPYSREDKRLLASVASQAGLALESIRLGEKIAEQIEAERRIAQEMEYAKQVQARLFPQKLPVMRTLQYAGGCIQARQVGGDYYDFLELRPGRLGLVLADIAGKGISGALLMANLQANLRSQYAVALDDLPRLLKSVNQLFYENSSDSSYATLFFADYEDSTRRLRYANCGHLPPLLVRGKDSRPAGGSPPAVERLEPTCTVLGLFEQWECSVAETQLAPGDTLIVYSDGVTEAENAEGEEFGEGRLIDTVTSQCHRAVSSLLQEVVATVQHFSGREQADDITLVVSRCLS